MALGASGLSLCIGRVTTILFAWLVVWSAALSPLSADKLVDDVEICTGLWKPYVELISEIVVESGIDLPILFINREGEIYNCLGESYPDEKIASSEMAEKSNPFIDRTSPIENNPEKWPLNVCSVSVPIYDGGYIGVHIPSDGFASNNKACLDRVHHMLSGVIN